MKKFILTMVIGLMAAISVNAQTATEDSKLLDNTYVGVEVGATTPLNFNSIFPVNPVAGVKFGKELVSQYLAIMLIVMVLTHQFLQTVHLICIKMVL